MNGEIVDEFDADVTIGEVVSLPPDFMVDHVEQNSEPMDYASHARMVGEIEAVDGSVYRTGLDEIIVTPAEQDGHYEVELKSRKNQVILATGAALLFAVGTGAALQYNRTHRKKKKK